MIKYEIQHKIVNSENTDSVTSHDLYPPPSTPSQSVTLSQTPPWSVTYFTDCALHVQNLHLFFQDEIAVSDAKLCKTTHKTESFRFEMENDYSSDDNEEEGPLYFVPFTINPQLAADVEKLENLSIVPFETILLHRINEYHVIVYLSTDFLDEESAAAWNLQYRKHVTMRLTLNLSKYMDSPRPQRVTITQGSQTSCGVLVQFQKSMTTFLQKSSERVTNDIIKKRFQSVVDLEQMQLPSSTETEDLGLENGFLVQVVKYAESKLRTLNEFCVVCDDARKLLSSMLKPIVCSSDLCVFSFQNKDAMAIAADYIKTKPEVVDLLIKVAKAACKSHRRELIFNPFPIIFDPENPFELALKPESPNYDKVLKFVENFPELEDLLHFDEVSLKKKLDDRDPLIYLLLQWIITNNRSHIAKLEPERQLDFMKTNHQYIMRTSSPAKEAEFAEARKKFGSTFAFYGSSLENWHSIFSNGLMKASGTEHQVNGAMYGDGIYLSPSASTSFNYCGLSENLDDQRLYCIALCEVIKSEDLVKEPNIWVVANPDHVVTRFLFVCTTSLTDLSINTESAHIMEKISSAYGQA